MAVEETIVNRLVADMSPVFNFNGDEPQRQSGATLVDRYGRQFDSAIHKTNDDGSPMTISVNGQARLACKRGRGGKSRQADSGAPADQGSVLADADLPPDAASAGQAIAESIFMLAQLIGGSEFTPQPNERQIYTRAWQTYCAQRNIDYVPPELIIVGATLGYVMPRFQQESVASRFAAWKTRVGMRWRNWRNRKHAARSNSGNDGIGQNHAGMSDGGSVSA